MTMSGIIYRLEDKTFTYPSRVLLFRSLFFYYSWALASQESLASEESIGEGSFVLFFFAFFDLRGKKNSSRL